jgi:hypothetical protein
MSRAARLQAKGKDDAIAAVLDLDVGESPAAHSFRTWNLGSWYADIESVPSTIGFVVVQGEICSEGDS